MTLTDEMRAALEIFAAIAEHDIGDDEADSDLFRPMTPKHCKARPLLVGDFRRAQAAFSKARGEA